MTQSRWFTLADLACVAVAGALLYNWPKLGGWPLLIALLPWVIRLVNRKFPFQPTRFDLFIILFLITAWVGVLVSYDQAMSLERYWLIVCAVFLYFALAGQPRQNLWIVTGWLGAFGAMVAGYFLVTHDWVAQPAKFESINQAGVWLMTIRPMLNTHQLHPNVAGSIIAMLAPFLMASGLHSWRARHILITLLILATGGLGLIGLLLTTSRGAWIALSAVFGLWGLWWVSGVAAKALRRELRKTIFYSALAITALIVLIFVIIYPGDALALVDRLPGPANAGTRLDLAQGAFDLVDDFPFTGGGLGAFPALYSQYIRVIPNFFIRHAHNLFLDVAIEQGIPGALALAAIVLGAGWPLATRAGKAIDLPDASLLRWGVLASLLVMLIHGLVEDSLYGSRGVLLLLLPAGMSVAVMRKQDNDPEQMGTSKATLFNKSLKRNAYAIILIFVFILLFNFRQPLLASWYADLSAVAQARIELDGWPTGEWDDGSNTSALEPAGATFHHVLQLDADNRTAHHRLGMIAMLRRDYSAAVEHLEAAFQTDPEHRGVRKNLGYSYAWAGQYEKALDVLAPIPEGESELNVYIWWWGTQGRADLSERAQEMVRLLGEQ